MPHTRFTKEFRDEAVRLALTSGRSRREVAADLGIGLSNKRPRSSGLGPDPARDGRRGGKKLALKFSLDF